MGVCASKPEGCVGISGRKLVRRTKHGLSRRRRAHSAASHKLSKVEPSASADLTYSNPAFQGWDIGIAECWFDPEMVIESDCDDDFHSVQDVFSQSGSFSSGVSPRFSDFVYHNGNAFFELPPKHEQSFGSLELNVVREGAAKVNSSADSQLKFNNPQSPSDKTSVQSMDQSGDGVEAGTFQNCAVRQNPCLACLACVASLDEKKKSLTPSSPGTRRKSSFTHILSFKRRETLSSSTLLSPKAVLQRPIAGSQIICSQLGKKMSNCWSSTEPNAFKIRGQNFIRDKKKEFAANFAAFYPFGVDVFLSARKIDHIARFVELPAIDSSGGVPPILVVNLQIPLYPPSIFQNEYDGEGMSIVLYFKLSDNYSKELPVHFQENIQRLIRDEIEKIRGFPVDTNAPFRERLKFLAKIVNVEDLQLSATEKKLLNAYNEKPVLTRPQHEFYIGENYFEMDLNIHRFSYIARKGVESFKDRLKNCVLDFGLTIQGNKAEDLPENMLCCIRLKEIDYTKCHQLGF